MKHNRLITRKPQCAQSNFEVTKEFVTTLSEQIVQWVFGKTS
jgi:hypothetical protein